MIRFSSLISKDIFHKVTLSWKTRKRSLYLDGKQSSRIRSFRHVHRENSVVAMLGRYDHEKLLGAMDEGAERIGRDRRRVQKGWDNVPWGPPRGYLVPLILDQPYQAFTESATRRVLASRVPSIKKLISEKTLLSPIVFIFLSSYMYIYLQDTR